MAKPPSIARFEQLYWASVIIGLINAALNWGTTQATLAANPLFANAGWFLPLTQVIGLAIAVLLWFFIVRRPSVVAKWVQVVFAAFGAFGLLSALFLLATGRAPTGTQLILGLFANILYIAAAVMLFRPDARLWFGEGLGEDDDLDAPRP
ncbi:hypothetical protein M9979_13870 [Sphingomonas sp. RP10(2022)]|uniref:Uncharacterized protein n=1 Tax=Sphingomonas liriopis TaxID=2949094 RepID=A0A9X2KRT1_9SPHN|nr:hypothetical protein [Sphingomonas liriopis]MCP3735956.1 hypothetical protein [Sphingomonas liriopis]